MVLAIRPGAPGSCRTKQGNDRSANSRRQMHRAAVGRDEHLRTSINCSKRLEVGLTIDATDLPCHQSANVVNRRSILWSARENNSDTLSFKPIGEDREGSWLP